MASGAGRCFANFPFLAPVVRVKRRSRLGTSAQPSRREGHRCPLPLTTVRDQPAAHSPFNEAHCCSALLAALAGVAVAVPGNFS